MWRVSLCGTRTRETREPFDTASVSVQERETQAAAEKAVKAQLAAQTEIDDLCWLMSDKRGRRFVWRQLGEAGVYRQSFTGEPLTSAFKEGQRSLGLQLMAAIHQHCPERFSEMQREARTNERRNERNGK
jgi:hypothetical protein